MNECKPWEQGPKDAYETQYEQLTRDQESHRIIPFEAFSARVRSTCILKGAYARGLAGLEINRHIGADDGHCPA